MNFPTFFNKNCLFSKYNEECDKTVAEILYETWCRLYSAVLTIHYHIFSIIRCFILNCVSVFQPSTNCDSSILNHVNYIINCILCFINYFFWLLNGFIHILFGFYPLILGLIKFVFFRHKSKTVWIQVCHDRIHGILYTRVLGFYTIVGVSKVLARLIIFLIICFQCLAYSLKNINTHCCLVLDGRSVDFNHNSVSLHTGLFTSFSRSQIT